MAWTEEQDALLLEARAAGIPVPEIARSLPRPISTVYQRLARLAVRKAFSERRSSQETD